jgi:ABC-type Mn2+/Zn2+ transport system permease subunit
MDTLYYYLDRFLSDPVLPGTLLGVLLAGLSCSLLSPLVIVKRMTLAGVGIGGAAIGGAIAGMLIFPALSLADWRIQAAGAAGAFLLALILLLFNRNSLVSRESILSVFIVGIFGLGLVASIEWNLQMPDLREYLYTSPNVSSAIDLAILSGFSLVAVMTVLLFFRPLEAICVDREFASVVGVPARFFEFLFVVLMTATILLSIYTAGLLFTLTLMILPGLCARILTVRLGLMILTAVVFSLISCVSGVILSQWLLELPVSIVLVLVQVALFILLFGAYRMSALWSYRIQ